MESNIQETSTLLEWAPIIISGVGIIINIFMINRSVKDAVITKQKDLNLEKLAEVPYLLYELTNQIVNNKPHKQQQLLKDLSKIHALIVAYGSQEAILITAEMQHSSYSANRREHEYRSLCYMSILTFQIKYDLTGVKGNLEHWYKIKFTDWNNIKGDLIKEHNELVKSLKLDKFLEIK